MEKINLPFLIDYDPNNLIYVNNEPYKILITSWINGNMLHKYIEKNLDNKKLLLNLAENFKNICQKLEQYQIGHGDLQHGNIMVMPNNDIKLIDYDGMYIPDFKGQSSHENGHPNYQHPQSHHQFDEKMDRFSAWCIYLSITAIAHDSTLFEEYYNKGDNLIFKKSDFENLNSQIWQDIEKIPDPIVKQTAMKFKEICKNPDFKNIEPLSPLIN